MLGFKAPLRKESATTDDERDGGKVRASPELSKAADESGVAPPSEVPVASSKSRLRAAARKAVVAGGVVTQLTKATSAADFSRNAFAKIASLSEEVGGGTL